MAEERHSAAFIVGAIIGGIAGAVATLWTTPRSGAEVRSQLSGAGGGAGSGAGSDAPVQTTYREERLSSRALGFVERAAAPLVGVRLGETAATRPEPDVTRPEPAVEATTDDIVVPVGTASGEPAPGDSGPGHAASTEELTSPVLGALDEGDTPQGDQLTPFPHTDQPPNSPR